MSDYIKYFGKKWNVMVEVMSVLIIYHLSLITSSAQIMLSLDSCRAMALRNSKQLGVAALKQDMAQNLRRSARTKYLPHVSAIGTYQ